MQQHQPVAMPKLPSRTRRSILTSLLLIAGAIFLLFFIPSLLSPMGQASPVSFFGIFALALAYPILLGYGLFSLARMLSRLYNAITIGMMYQLVAWSLFLIRSSFSRYDSSSLESLSNNAAILIALLILGLLSIAFMIYGLINIRQQRYLP